jgi:hypothetical protein
MSGLQSKIKLQARKETMFQTKYGTDTIPKYEPDQLAGERMEEIVRNLPTFSRMVLKAAYVQYPYHLGTQLSRSVLKSPRTGTSRSLKKRTNWLLNL